MDGGGTFEWLKKQEVSAVNVLTIRCLSHMVRPVSNYCFSFWCEFDTPSGCHLRSTREPSVWYEVRHGSSNRSSSCSCSRLKSDAIARLKSRTRWEKGRTRWKLDATSSSLSVHKSNRARSDKNPNNRLNGEEDTERKTGWETLVLYTSISL